MKWKKTPEWFKKRKEHYKRPCAGCRHGPCEPAHIRSDGAGGDISEGNLMPLCRRCHRFQEDNGWFSLCQVPSIGPRVLTELLDKGFTFDKWNKVVRQ